MNYQITDLQDLEKKGVYRIKCLCDNKSYIGSTTVTFYERLNHHINQLKNNKHKNSHLQNAYNLYGEDCFEIVLVEFYENDDIIIEREQFFLDTEFDDLFNINPIASGTPNMSKETIAKRANTMREKYASGEIVSTFIGKEPWNKGLTADKHDYSYLKVKKTITPELLQAHENTSIRSRENSPSVQVYDKNQNLLGVWNSAKDLEEWSLTEENNLPIESRFKSERMGVPIKMLNSGNVGKSCKNGKLYKGLYFKYAEYKSGELSGTPEEDNTEPSLRSK